MKNIIGSNTIVLQFPLLREYDIAGKVQVIRVPQYVSPVINGTLSCLPWDGTIGGILAIDATDSIMLNAGLDVSAKGFRGGQVICGGDFITDTAYVNQTPSLVDDAPKGEGIAFYGISPFTSSKGAPANGGGGGNTHTGGGAGGANFGCGGNGGWSYPITTYYRNAQGLGGHFIDYSSLQNKIFMGGGGGAGSEHAPECDGTSGANGGGIILITANTLLANSGLLIAKGDSSLNGGSSLHAGGIGGAGAGGTVLLSLNSISGNLNVDVGGGKGGNPTLMGAGPGGGGGGGLCWISSVSLTGNISLNDAGGISGIVQGNYYGALAGCTGGMLSGLVVPINTAMPGVRANFSVTQSNPIETNVVINNSSSNAVSYYWNFGDGVTDSIFNPTHIYSAPGIYSIMLVADDTMNCKDTTMQVVITDLGNVFTPNGDGKNDLFSFPNFELEKYSLNFLIYDRWGVNVFHGGNSNNNWDGNINGKKAPEGTYYYVIEITEKTNGKKIVKKGYVTLLR